MRSSTRALHDLAGACSRTCCKGDNKPYSLLKSVIHACSAAGCSSTGRGAGTSGAALGAAGAAALGLWRAAHTLTVGTTYTMERTFGPAEVTAFTQLTGDSNPIHTADSSAIAEDAGTAQHNSSSNGSGGSSGNISSRGGAAGSSCSGDGDSSGDKRKSDGNSRGDSSSQYASAVERPALGTTPIVPGMLLASLFPAIIGSNFSGALYATQSLAFRSPCVVAEPVRAEITVVRASGSRVQFETVCRAACDGRKLVDGMALAIIPPQVD